MVKISQFATSAPAAPKPSQFVFAKGASVSAAVKGPPPSFFASTACTPRTSEFCNQFRQFQTPPPHPQPQFQTPPPPKIPTVPTPAPLAAAAPTPATPTIHPPSFALSSALLKRASAGITRLPFVKHYINYLPGPWSPRWSPDFCVLNYYTKRDDFLSAHSDPVQAIGPWALVAGLTLGASRVFRMKPVAEVWVEYDEVGIVGMVPSDDCRGRRCGWSTTT